MKLTALILALVFASCGTTIYAPKEQNLNRPLGLEVTALDDLKFRVSFYISNEEEIFLGYNLYAARVPITDGDFDVLETSRLIKLILPAGEEPTYAYTFSDANSISREERTVHYFDGRALKFECGFRYYFRMRAVGEGLRYSRPGNEDSDVALTQIGQPCP